MEYTITCDGVPIGTAWFAPLSGLAHADLRSLPAYAAIHQHANAAAQRLMDNRVQEARYRDFAEDFARTWTGGRLAVVDPRGSAVAAASVMIVNATRVRAGPRVIVDMRPDTARADAILREMPAGSGDRSRPAA
jgi:hypothetical protein